MEDDKQILTKATDTANKVKNTGKNLFKNYITTITLLVLIILTVVISLCELVFKDSIDTTFWINLAYMVLISCVALMVMIPLGSDSEKKNLKGYFSNRTLWSKKTSTIINNGLSTNFSEYCKDYTNRLRKEKRENYVLSASISLDDFYKTFNKMSPKELRDYYKKCKKNAKQDKYGSKMPYIERDVGEPIDNTINLSREQYRLLQRTKKAIRVKPIIPTKILSDSRNKTEYSVGQGGGGVVAKVLLVRILGIIAYSLLIVSVMIVPTGASGIETFIIIMMRIFGIVTSTVMGFNAGRVLVQNDNSNTLDRITFLVTFLETKKDIQQDTDQEVNF